MSGALAGILCAAACVGLAAPARAVADESLSESGSLTYTWQGDPARGCAAVGVCGVQGALTMQLQGGSSANSFGKRIDVALEASTATVRVSGPAGDCVDVAGGPFGGDLFIGRSTRSGLVGRIQPPLSSGRCAGPRQQDFARLTLPVRRFGGKQPSYDLRTSRSFAAGPFTGEFVSTVVLRHATSGGFSSSFSSSSGPPSGPTHKAFLERATLRYRVTSVSGTLDVTFAGVSDPFCLALDSCGTSGTLALSIPRFRQTIVVNASRVVPVRPDARQVLADLKAGRLSVDGAEPVPFAPPVVGTTTTETFVAGDGSNCQATTRSRQANLFFSPGALGAFRVAQVARARPALSVTLSDPFASSVLRTFCPGPLDSDVFGTNQGVAHTSVGLAQLLRRHSVFSLSRTGNFAGTGYAGTRGGAIKFSMTLERVQTAVTQTRVPGSAS